MLRVNADHQETLFGREGTLFTTASSMTVLVFSIHRIKVLGFRARQLI